MQQQRLTLGHSPDPDDAFMFYALAKELIPTHGFRFEHILQDIQTLNERATREPNGPDRSSYGHPGSALLKRTHAASSAQPPPRQLSWVQYPPGWEISHKRSPRMEQSVETWHSSPI